MHVRLQNGCVFTEKESLPLKCEVSKCSFYGSDATICAHRQKPQRPWQGEQPIRAGSVKFTPAS